MLENKKNNNLDPSFSPDDFIDELITGFKNMQIYEPQKQWIIEKIKNIPKENNFNTYTKDMIIQKVNKILENSENEFLDRFLEKLSIFLEYGGIEDVKLNKFDRKKLVYFRVFEPLIDGYFENLLTLFGVSTIKELFLKFGAKLSLDFKRYFSSSDYMKNFASEFRKFVKEIENL